MGAADLAKTMGSDYAKDTLAGQIAAKIQSLVGDAPFAKAHPTVAAALSGGIDNAMQAFVESYADQAIDAAMGDTEAAKQMLTQENFLSALESGLSGGVSGAMGGAAGTGVRVVKAKAEQKVQNAMEARAQAAQKAAAEKAKTPSVTSGDSSLGEGALEGQTAVNDDPAVHTAAQNASIEEYKNSVDPAMAKYVDDVRAGKKLEPFVVSKTGDRMRSAMMELTGLDKVGDYTMLDNNGVMHITNRHAGGDGSADATMKESADVARAAYVLNNFDNAYLAKDRADGYMTSNGKRAPIVLFEKKIDGSHIVVEAVCDTKKNKNFIVSEYLSKNGVDEKEIAKVLRSPVNAAADPEDNVRNVVADPSAMTAPPPQSPMDAVADFRDTSETLAEDHGAEASIAPETARVNEKGVENAGETVETARVNDYADVDRKVDPAGLDAADEGSGQMRETYGLREPSGQTARQSEVQRQLEQWGVESGKTKAAQDISQKLPANVDADRYAAAASTIYHLAQMDEVKSFDDALRLAGVMDNTALNVNYILDSGEGGRIALNTAYLYGADTKEQAGGYGGGLTDQSTSGQGLVYYKGTLDHDGTDMGSRIIELNAAATGTDAVLKNVLQNNPNVRAYVDSETARIFFGDSVSDIFGTVLHEDYHWYNSLDQAGAKSLQDHALTYLAQMDGYESVDEMIRDKMDVYASQKLTYEQAAEELVADAWRGIFATEADFKRWVEFQRGQAEKNAGVRGSIHKVMNRVKNLLSDIISRAKEVLTIDPGNAAALKAKRLAEAQRRTLQDEYFAHAEKAMDNLRSAKENAAALKTESAAEERSMRFQLQEGEETLEKQLNRNLGRLEQMTPAAEITGKEIEYGATSKENAENIVRFFESIGGKVERDGFGVVELTRKGAKATVQHGNGPVKQIAAAAIPNVIRYGEQIGFVENWKGRGYNTHTFVAPVVVDGIKIYEAVIVNEYRSTKQGNKFYVHEVCGSDGSLLVLDDAGQIKQKQESADTVLKTEEGGERPNFPAKNSIAQDSAESKRTDEPVKKSVRFQMSAPVEVDSQKDLVAVHNLTEENLREALELGGLPSPSIAVVKAQEGHTQYGPISLVFNSDTIDPMVNRANRIYGSDAWTPTRPNVEYEVHADKAVKLNSELAQLSRQTAGGAFARGNVLSGTLDMEASGKSPKQLAESLSRNDAVKAAYLADKGETVQVVTKQEVRFTESQKKRYEKIMEALGGEAALRDIVESDVVNGNHDKSNAVLNEVREAEKSWAMEEFGWSEEKAQTKADRLIAPMLRARLENAYEYVTTKDMAGKTVQDTEAMQNELQQKAPDADVEEWLLPKMEGILGKKGIRNEKDPYTRTGNRRSFAQLHNPYTLQNLVEAMNQQNARGEGAWGLSANTLMSTATAEYQNLDEVRADKGRLQQMPAEEYKALLEQADGQIEEVISRIRQETVAHSNSGYGEREILGEILLRAAQGKQTMAAVSKAFSKEGYTISRETAKQIVALYKTIADIPTGYFEAKPQRAVGFDEVRAAIVPDNASAALLDSLKEKGVTVYEYKAGDDAQRTKVLNQVPDVRFQMAEQADRDAKRNRQRQASRTIADNSAAIKTLTEMMGLTCGVRVSDDSILGVAERLVKASGAKGKADTERVAREMRTLIEYMKTEGADMNKAQGLAETIAGEILDEATYRNTELWQQYPEYHELSYTVDKNGKAKAELVRQYGSWSEAVAEARKHGVKLRQEEGHRDGNPAEEYEAIVNDTRSMGGTKQGAAELFRGAAKAAGVDGAASMESAEWLDVLMNVHDTIKPKMMSRFADVAEYEDAKVELAGRMIGDLLNVNEMNDAQAIFDSFQQWQRRAAAAAAGDETSAAKAVKDLRAVQKEQTREFNRRLAENQKAGNQSEAVQQMQEQQRRNAKAEAMLDANLDALGVDITNSGDMAEKLDVLKEAYEREWRAEKKRLKEERQQMLDEITLENKTLKAENRDLARQVANEQRRADRAEYSQIVQEREIMEWEAENQKKAEAWQQKQAQKNAIAVEVARQQRDEDIAVAKALAEKRVQRARDGRKADELKRSIRNNAAQLNQMILRPSKGKYVQPRLIQQAAKAVKDLRAVQKEQTREFNRRLAENQKAGNQSEAVQQMQEQQRRNAKAEAMLDANLDALGVDITNSGDMAEKLDVLKEAYEREWRAEKKRLKEERQQMLDEITLENKTLKAENRDLARQVANEQRRADRAEYSQIVQEREIMEWEAENQKKAEAWQQKQAQKNAIAVEVARQQRDEDIAVAKALAEKRVQRARDGRKADELKRSIRNNAAQLNQMILRPSKGKYVQPRLIQQAAEVAKLADMAVLNDAAVRKLTALANTISQTQGTASDPSSLAYDWEQTGVPKLIQALQADMMNAKQAKLDRLHQQLTEAEALGDGEKAERLRDRLKARIRETENRTYLPMTVEQLRMLKAITAGTLHVIRTENKTLSLAKAEEVDAFAQKAGLEVLAAKGNESGRIRDALTKYNLDMLGAKRVFRMLGGYTKNGQMEKLADMLNQGQLRQTQITVEGTKLFDNVTGKANLKQMERFAGPGAELVDIGLTDAKGKAVPLTHGQLCSLYMHLQNTDSREHLLNGGLTLPDTTLYNEGDIERAYQKGQTVKIGMLTGADGMPMADTILNTVENALTDYDRKWIEDMKGFFGDYTTNLINETSMKLVGFQRATVKNYYPIAVDKTQLASEIEGLKLDATIEGRGMLKERVKSGLPILLEECSSVVQRSLRDTAAYAGLAAPIRDANRILNANVETEDGIQKLKSGVLKEHWGRDAVNYVDYLLTDLQTKQRKRSDGIGRVMGKLRGNYAGAILTLNPGVAIAQAASLPTAGAVLGSDTMAAVLPFVKNLSGKQRRALEAEISEHGDALLQYRLRGSQRGELASIGVSGSFAEKAMDKLPKSVTGWINSMDEITVAALWEGAKHYVEHHAAEFADGAATKGSDAYWKAVNQMYQKVIEETQPNYTVMQRAGIQRSDNEITKTLTMFTTQRFQNYGILADAVMDYNAQRARYNAEKSAENKAEKQRAGQSLRRAATSQVIQTAVFALMKIGADFLLHRWDREQDENGDVTAESLWNRFAGLFTESAAGNFLFGSEIYSMVGNAVNGTDYDVVSATNISAVNDLFAAATKLYTLLRKDTTGMDEEELEAYHRKLRKAGVDVMEYGLDIAGIPAANGRKMVEAFAAYADDVQGLANGEGFSLNGTPASATGQYDRLFNAIERGDAEEAAAALGKLEQMGKSDKVKAELKKRLKNYDPDIETAAKARNAGNDRTRQKATEDCIRALYKGLGIREGVKEDAAKREAIIDLVTGAVNQKADELLAGDKDRNVYDDLTDALEAGRAKDVQTEIDRLLTAGKDKDAIKSKITGVVKSEYLAGNDHDREKLAEMLLRLEAGGEPLYEEKNFESWIKQDEKKQEAAAGAVDEWAEVR